MEDEMKESSMMRFKLLVAIIFFLTRAHFVQSQECSSDHDEAAASANTCKDGTSSLTKVRIGLEWFTNPDHLPLVVAQKHGFFREFGLDVDLVEPESHWDAEEEILAGRLDIAVTEPLHLSQDAAKGRPVLGFARFLHTDGGVMYKKNAGINRPSDMCGKTISYPGSPGKGGPAIVNTMVKADGKLDCDLESYGKYNGGFYHNDALQSDKADLATLIFWNFEVPDARSRGMDVDFFSLKNWGVPDFCQLVLFTTPEKFAEKKNVLRQVVLAMRRATGIIHQQPDLAASYFNEYVKEPPPKEVMDATLPAFPNDNSMATEYYERLMAWLVETEQVEPEEVVPVQTYWTNEIAW